MPIVTFSLQLICTGIGVALIYGLAQRRQSLPIWTFGPLVIVLFVFEYASFRASFPTAAFWDFTQCYYPAGQAALHHDLSTLTLLYQRVVQGFVNMPVVAYAFAPFSLFGARMASVLYTLIGIGATAAAWYLLARLTQLGPRERWLLAFLFLANGPLINSLKLGNTSHFILFALVAGLVLLRAGRSVSAGIVLGAATILKPALLLFGIFFVLRRDWRGTFGFAGVGIVIALLSLLLFGWAFNQFWFQTSILQFSHQWFSAFTVQSIPGFILRLRAGPGLLTSWQPALQTSGERLAAQIIVAALYLIATVACIGALRASRTPTEVQAARRRDLQYLLVICLALISSPLSWSHYYCWLLVPTAFFLGPWAPAIATRTWRGLIWAAITLVTPLIVWPPSLANSSLMTLYQSLVVSHLLLGGILWFCIIAVALACPYALHPPEQANQA